MPEKLDAPQLVSPGKLRLTVRTVNGSSVNSNRLPGLELRANANLTVPRSQWMKVTNALTLTNGTVQLTNVDATPAAQFFIVSEPK